jgi:DNA-binding PadR family transcriptional regulator
MSPQQIAQMISKDLTNEDSIFGVGYGLYKKGINDQEVVDALNILSKNGFANFSPRQERELAEYYSLNYQGANTLGDILWDSTLFAQVFHSLGISKQKISPLEKLKIKLGKE